jgi:hypothetical protein
MEIQLQSFLKVRPLHIVLSPFGRDLMVMKKTHRPSERSGIPRGDIFRPDNFSLVLTHPSLLFSKQLWPSGAAKAHSGFVSSSVLFRDFCRQARATSRAGCPTTALTEVIRGRERVLPRVRLPLNDG